MSKDNRKPQTSDHPDVLKVRESAQKLKANLERLGTMDRMLAVKAAAGKIDGISIASEALGVASSRVFLLRNEKGSTIVSPYGQPHGGNPIDKAAIRYLKRYVTSLQLFIASIDMDDDEEES